jgi:dihydrofolate reductase
MRTITVQQHVSLDGVMQAPGRPDEDPRDGFDRGGWGRAYDDEALGAVMAARMPAGPGAMLFGRRTYEDLVGHWLARDDGNPYTDAIREATKYVVGRGALPHENSVAVRPDGLAALKAADGPDLLVLGSTGVVAALRERDLVDRWVLVVCPLLLGRGRRLFPDGPPADLRLVDSVPTPAGVVVATYEPAR